MRLACLLAYGLLVISRFFYRKGARVVLSNDDTLARIFDKGGSNDRWHRVTGGVACFERADPKLPTAHASRHDYTWSRTRVILTCDEFSQPLSHDRAILAPANPRLMMRE